MNKPLIAVTTLALSLVLSFPMMSLTQHQFAAGQQSQEKIDVPLNFTLKAKGDGGDEEGNASSTKDVTVNLKVQTSQAGSPTEIPITAKVSNDTKTQDLELCASLQEGKEMCNSLKDLMKSKGENQSSSESSGSDNSTNKNNDDEDN
ncbi:hypothetical protein BH18THE1_BH18THE1_03170 [soil metagenome]